MTRGWLVVAAMLSAIALAGCGGSSSTTHARVSSAQSTPTTQSTTASATQSTPTSTSTPSETTTTAQTTTPAAQPSAAPTCDQFCLQAAPEGGPNSDGCRGPDGKPYSATSAAGCLNCPSGGCLDIVSTSVTATNGIVPVQLRCKLDVACNGALLILQPNNEGGGSQLPYSEWVGGSDFSLPPHGTGSVNIALTALGRRLASSNGYNGSVFVQLKMYGQVQTGVALLIRS